MLNRYLSGLLLMVLATCAGPVSQTGKFAVDSVPAYESAWQADLASAQTLFNSLKTYSGPASVESTLTLLNDLEFMLFKGSAGAELMANVHPAEEMRSSAEQAQQAFSNLATELGLSREAYDNVVAVDVSAADAATQRYHANTIRDFKRAGVDQDAETRAKIRALQEELVVIGQDFGKNIREDVRSVKLDSVAELAGLPDDFIAGHQPGEDGMITITTDYPDYLPYMTYAESDARRFELYIVYKQRGYPANVEVLEQMIARRHELANLLGYETWADYITSDKMIGSAQAVAEFIERVNEVADPASEVDYQMLFRRLKKLEPDAIEVGDWQKTYLGELVQLEEYSYDSQEARQYFAYDKVRDGLFTLTQTMLGLTYKPYEAEVWHASVQSYEVWDGDEIIGRFHLDMHPRDGKFKHAAAFPMLPGVTSKQLPEVALVCNVPGGDGTPGLMSHGQVRTFFHEFGHLLHHILGGNHQWVALSGIATEWDFVEAPSQLLEEWIWDKASLQSFAFNEAGEPIPDELVEKMQAARKFGNGLGTRHQMYYAALSLNYYNRSPDEINTTDLMVELMEQYSPFHYIDDTYFMCSFGHLDGYSAIYYTYMWSLVIAKDLFSRFEAEGMLNPEVAGQYRRFILEPGGSKPAAELVQDFLGREYNFEAFANWLSSK